VATRRAEYAGQYHAAFVAGHGIQTSNEGGILLLQDVGHPDSEPLDRALDVAAIRLGMVADPTDPNTSTPPVQYYFYDACRVQPAGVHNYQELNAGIGSDIPRGPAPDMSWCCGAVGHAITRWLIRKPKPHCSLRRWSSALNPAPPQTRTAYGAIRAISVDPRGSG
jgi:hypothetical protein